MKTWRVPGGYPQIIKVIGPFESWNLWLVGGFNLPTPPKNILWKSVGMMTFPIYIHIYIIYNIYIYNIYICIYMGSHSKFHGSKPPTRWDFGDAPPRTSVYHHPGGDSSGCSSSSSARPSFPPRAVRPTRCTYCCRLLGAVIWTTKVTWMGWGRHEKWKGYTMKHDEQWGFTMKRAGLYPAKRYYIRSHMRHMIILAMKTEHLLRKSGHWTINLWEFTIKGLGFNHNWMVMLPTITNVDSWDWTPSTGI